MFAEGKLQFVLLYLHLYRYNCDILFKGDGKSFYQFVGALNFHLFVDLIFLFTESNVNNSPKNDIIYVYKDGHNHAVRKYVKIKNLK